MLTNQRSHKGEEHGEAKSKDSEETIL